MSLADLGLPVAQSQYLAQWLDAMQTAFPGYVPAQGNLEYIQAQVFASWAADLAQLCSAGSMELFRQFGAQLLGLPYEQGTPALAIATVNAVNTNGYTLPQGTQFTLTLSGAAVAFQTVAALTIAAGSSSGTVALAAVQSGTVFNGASTPISLVSQIDWVSSVALVTNASGGVDQEDDSAYVQRVAQTLTTLGVATATANALATRALDFTPTPGTDQQQVGRSTAIDGYSPSSSTFTVTANGTNTLTVTSAPTSGTATLTAAPGASITGTDIPAGTIVDSSTTASIVMSAAATGSASGIVATVGGTLGNERTVTLCVTDASGNALNSDTMTAVQAYLAGFREENFVIDVISPTYTTVYVTATVSALPGYTAATVQANVQAALLAYLSPANFGLPQGAIQGWQNSQTIYRSAVTAIIQNTLGVLSVVPSTLAIGFSAGPTNTTTDLTLPGDFPLPMSTSTSIPLSAITVA